VGEVAELNDVRLTSQGGGRGIRRFGLPRSM
jgi:hypothetical protein